MDSSVHREHVRMDGSYQARVVYVSNEDGTVQLEFCTTCAEPVGVLCEHVNNDWKDNGTRLICRLCGADGT